MDLDAMADEETKGRHKGPPCWGCSIPERAWVEKARKEGRTLSVIAAVLIRNGHSPDEATTSRIGQHLRNHVR